MGVKVFWNKTPKSTRSKKPKNPDKAVKWDKEPRRYIDEDYLVYVASLPCCISGSTKNIEAHHTKLKADKVRHDYYAVPLSAELHYIYHHKSRVEFYEIASKVGINCDEDLRQYALNLYQKYLAKQGETRYNMV